MVESLLTLDASSCFRRPRTQMHAHTHTCYKRGRTKCSFGAPFVPSDSTKILVPFPPLADDTDPAEKAEQQRLKMNYDEMHEGLEFGEFAKFGHGSEDK